MTRPTHSIRCRMFLRWPHSMRLITCSMALVGFLCYCSTLAWAINPDAPDVKNVIAKGLKFLETATHDTLGGKCLIGLVFLKNGENEKHRKSP